MKRIFEHNRFTAGSRHWAGGKNAGRAMLTLFMLAFFCLGMGGTSGTFGPAAEKDRFFRAEIKDRSDKSHEVQGIFVQGSTYLPARTGSAEAEVDFGKIESARFYVQDDRVLARVTMVNQEEMDFYIQPQTTFQGKTDWGSISFRADEIKEISFK
ncbi:conserved hypothetical protein [Desulfonatronospira thiodismutans ASO3-1]|uniref:Uncharacterized protein n=1 Tax=Desulfonatronospira thiodismutans ASO3-1 TaxID=555779 RepID=D6ST05_9BACT|nr:MULTISPECIES: hypothetical protein [Desulfonatronospira]EFI33821.1 conserved hypothetical protein [Desulfonatronospira thiodismutans ASO3-1]RQD77079.1 MAG: hypothetical protein D5S03_05100 [Desulfonatronospira sp. MSAO_Bac3]